MLNLPGVFALLTRYAPACSPCSFTPPQGKKCAHPAGEKRSKDYIRTCRLALSLSIYLSRTRQESIRAVDCSLARNLLCPECP